MTEKDFIRVDKDAFTVAEWQEIERMRKALAKAQREWRRYLVNRPVKKEKK